MGHDKLRESSSTNAWQVSYTIKASQVFVSVSNDFVIIFENFFSCCSFFWFFYEQFNIWSYLLPVKLEAFAKQSGIIGLVIAKYWFIEFPVLLLFRSITQILERPWLDL